VTRVRLRWFVVVAMVTAGVVLSLTACNSSEADDSGASASGPEQAALDFARCMRENGVPTFPDPIAQPDGSFGLQRPAGVSTEAIDDALASCESEAQALGIASGAGDTDTGAQDQLLKLSRCMRANGIPEFPDPEPGTDLVNGLHGLFAEFDLESPRVAQALESCQPVLNQILEPVHGG
jgi:hypothetical protein